MLYDVTSDDDPDEPEDIGSPKKTRQREPGGRLRLINGRAVYRIWGYDALKEECKARGIALPNNWIQKSSLEKKLKLSDGLPDYESSSEWPFEKLREVYLARGLPINSEHLKNVYRRPELIRVLESDDLKNRQAALGLISGRASTGAAEDGVKLAHASDTIVVSGGNPIQDGSPSAACPTTPSHTVTLRFKPPQDIESIRQLIERV